MRMFASLVLAAMACLGAAEEITIRMMAGTWGIPPKEATNPGALVRRAVFDEFHRQNPDVRVVNTGGLTLQADMADNMFLLAMAGGMAPDVFYVNFRQYYTFLEQGFCRPLDDLIAQNPEVLDRANPTVLKVIRSFDGKTYAIPFFQVALGLYYRKDFFREAGLDPNRPPQTWAEFIEYGRRLTESKPGRYGWMTSNLAAYHWQNFVYQSGGEIVGPTPSGVWRSRIDSAQTARALDFFRGMVTDTWEGPSGKRYGPMAALSANLGESVRTGQTAMWFSYTDDVVMQQTDVQPSLVGIAALPAGPAGRKNEINAGMWAINAQITDPKKLDACWRFIRFFAGTEAARVNTDKMIDLGMGNLVSPYWLERFGHTELLNAVDPGFVEANRTLFQTGHPEPYGRNTQQVYFVLNEALDQARLDTKKPARQILKEVGAEMDAQLLGYTDPAVMAQRRGWAGGILGTFALLLSVWGVATWRRTRLFPSEPEPERLPAGTDRRRMWRFVGMCLMPAILTLLVWAYYPLARGLLIAFQDYKLLGGTSWVGLDNFINVFTREIFYKSLFNSFLYVGLSILIGFFLPIFLALALHEIPVGKVLFRTLFYLPAMTSAIVIAFLWRQFYDKTDQGILNSLLGPVIANVVNPVWTFLGHAPLPTANDWLGNPSLAMFAVVLPGIWAGAGPGSILYLAALKNISEDRYEAADLDGANWMQKIRHITLPGLKPLILINLLGVFIAGFKAMENVFVLTNGGPLNATRTIGLEIWQSAFMFLRFGYATAAAWVMGAILIGFTLIQIRSLLRMRFTTAR